MARSTYLAVSEQVTSMLNHFTQSAPTGLIGRTPAQDHVASIRAADADEVIKHVLRSYFEPAQAKEELRA